MNHQLAVSLPTDGIHPDTREVVLCHFPSESQKMYDDAQNMAATGRVDQLPSTVVARGPAMLAEPVRLKRGRIV